MAGTSVLITGISTRAAAESAARAGFDVLAIDAFADLDHHPAVRVWSLPRDHRVRFTPRRAARVAATMAGDAVVYLSSFENHPAAVAALASGRQLWGNAPSVLRRVRDPIELMRVFACAGCVVPATRRATDVAVGGHHLGPPVSWLLKPRDSGGGQGVSRWSPGMPVRRRHYLQEYIDGVAGSVVFVAARGRAVSLGVSRQLTGDPAFGAGAYRYCGSILAPGQFEQEGETTRTACALASAVAAGFGLIGVGSVDFVARGGVPYPIEVNPRWTASMELVERAHRVSLFGVHAEACQETRLPLDDLSRPPTLSGAVGKAVIFARATVVVGDTRPWLDDPTVRDVPRPGSLIERGDPICTVFAEAGDAASCYERLVERASRVYRALDRNCSTSAMTSSGFSSLG